MKATKWAIAISLLICVFGFIKSVSAQYTCAMCRDTGKCWRCKGTGNGNNPDAKCGWCSGTGRIGNQFYSTACEKCGGTGKLIFCTTCNGSGNCPGESHSWNQQKTNYTKHKVKMDKGLWFFFIVCIGSLVYLLK